MRVLLLAVALNFAFHCGALAFTDFGVCDNCYSSAQFAQAAEDRSLSLHPGMTGIDPVYIVNPSSADARFFHVHRSIDPFFDPLGAGSVSQRSRPPVSARSETGSSTVSGGFFVAEAVEAVGDPQIIQALEDTSLALSALIESLRQPMSSDDIDGLEDLDSAIQLLGPEDGPAGMARVTLRNAIRNYLNNPLNAAGIAISGEVVGIWNRLVGETLHHDGVALIVVFPDGTIVEISITVDVVWGTFANSWNPEIKLETVRWPGQSGFPQSAGQFSGYNFTGPYADAWQVKQLALRYGIPIGSSGCTWGCPSHDLCTLSCSRR